MQLVRGKLALALFYVLEVIATKAAKGSKRDTIGAIETLSDALQKI